MIIAIATLQNEKWKCARRIKKKETKLLESNLDIARGTRDNNENKNMVNFVKSLIFNFYVFLILLNCNSNSRMRLNYVYQSFNEFWYLFMSE